MSNPRKKSKHTSDTEMQNEIQSMLMYDCKQILEGTKTTTIREGHCKISLGPLLFKGTEGKCPDVEVKVTGFTHTYLDAITDEDAKKDGYENVDELRLELYRVYVTELHRYKELPSHMPVTIVEFVFNQNEAQTPPNRENTHVSSDVNDLSCVDLHDYVDNDTGTEEECRGVCYECHGDCNPLSQLCGTCSRQLSFRCSRTSD